MRKCLAMNERIFYEVNRIERCVNGIHEVYENNRLIFEREQLLNERSTKVFWLNK